MGNGENREAIDEDIILEDLKVYSYLYLGYDQFYAYIFRFTYLI